MVMRTLRTLSARTLLNVLFSAEIGHVGSYQWREQIPQRHRLHPAGKTPQPACRKSSYLKYMHCFFSYFRSHRVKSALNLLIKTNGEPMGNTQSHPHSLSHAHAQCCNVSRLSSGRRKQYKYERKECPQRTQIQSVSTNLQECFICTYDHFRNEMYEECAFCFHRRTPTMWNPGWRTTSLVLNIMQER